MQALDRKLISKTALISANIQYRGDIIIAILKSRQEWFEKKNPQKNKNVNQTL